MSRASSYFETITNYLGDAAIPKRYRKHIERYLQTAGMGTSPQFLFGVIFHISFVLSLILTVFLVFFVGDVPAITRVIFFIIFWPFMLISILLLSVKVVQLYLDARIYRRVREMEEVFPEFLSELSLNLKAGQSIEDGLSDAAKEDFGILSVEMRQVTTKVQLGYDLGAALRLFTHGYKSDTISESFELIYLSWRKGAQTPQLIDRMVDNMKVTRHLRDKLSASVANYQIFLATVTVLITPAMMALAFHFINLVRTITSEIMETTSSAVLPVTINAVSFNDNHFIYFSVLAVIAISVFSSMIISFITSGSVKDSWRTLFIYAIASVGSYFLFLAMFSGLFLAINP
jgi:Flp pilus assembly protein TadB